MARPTLELVTTLRATAAHLEAGAAYKWSHFGQCNCGHLAQTVTRLSPQELQAAAFATREGDWGEQARDYCPSSGYPLDYVLSRLFAIGMEPEDVQHLERLSDSKVLKHAGVQALSHTRRDHVVLYMRAWADLLEQALPETAYAEQPLAAE
jgi:hypothetical protein